nr:MAG TPA: hypothetical protein [Caudoviricetes sp.]
MILITESTCAVHRQRILRRWLYGQASRSMQRPDISSAEI